MNLKERKISDGIIVFGGRHPLGIGVTATVVSSGNDAIVFDSLLYPEDSLELLSFIARMKLNLKGLVNTHWHVDHTGGNQLFSGSRRIISSGLCVELMHTKLEDQITWLNKELGEESRVRPVFPNETISDGSFLELGEEQIQFYHTPGHTPDSIIAFLKNRNIIIAGDTVMELPYLFYGESQPLVDSLKRIQQLAKNGTIIQGHGGTCSSEKLDLDISYIEVLKKEVRKSIDSGKTAKQATQSLKLSDCVGRERMLSLPQPYEEVHSENVQKIFAELEKKIV